MIVTISSDGPIKVVAFEADMEGEKGVDVDLDTSPKLREKLLQLTNEKEKAILVDLSNVKYMDSSGIATLVEALQKVGKYGGRLKLTNLRDAVQDVFQLSRLDKVFDIYETYEDARNAF